MNYILHLPFRHVAGSHIRSDICFEFCPVIRQKATTFLNFFLILIQAEQIGKWTVGCLRLFVTLLCCVIHALKQAALGSQFVFSSFFPFFPSANVLHFYLNRLNCSFWDTATFWKKEEALVRCVSLKTLKSQQQSKRPPVLMWGLLHKVKDV